MSMAISATDLSCGYAEGAVLKDVSFDLRSGNILALLGPNGCGKSTLLRTVVGELKALGGKLDIEGAPADSLTSRQRAQKMAFVPSEEKTEFAFLAKDIVCMGRIPHSEGLFDSAEDKRIAFESLLRVECAHLAERPITNLSAGEHQRVLLARALAQQAPILLLDEPTSHLDPGHQVSFVRLIRGLAAEGRAVLVALHDLNVAAHLADEILILHEGRCVFDGPVEDAMYSRAIDEAYGVSFERIKGSDGVVRLSPVFAPAKA